MTTQNGSAQSLSIIQEQLLKDDKSLLKDFSIEEINQILKISKKEKATGSDEIPIETLKNLLFYYFLLLTSLIILLLSLK